MLSSIKIGGRAWTESLGVLARSPAYVIALAAIVGLWGLAGYEWLWLPESSGWVLALALAWVLALAALAAALLAGTVASVSAVAAGTDRRLSLRKIVSFEKKRVGRSVLVALAGLALGFVLDVLFGWINGRALEAASFLTFHTQQPVSYMLIGKILWVLEALVWIAFAGFLITWLLALSNPRPPAAPRTPATAPARSLGISVFVTSVLSAGIFGGLAWRVAIWHPAVKAGGWDYAQLAIRTGAALLLLSLGWLFWAQAIARLTRAPLTEPAASPPPS
ncbi:MAG TPA: hypothetical protein VL523_06820 [Terriglobia bacterium]|nr:hypothetical protein [Terriglobia bacterium]